MKEYSGNMMQMFQSAVKTLFTDRPDAEDMLIQGRLRIMRWVLLVAAIAIPFFGFLPELFYITPDLNDSAFHLGVARNTIDAIRHGLNPLDFWVPTWLNGFPLFHYYQPGPYLFLALLHFLTGGHITLLLLYRFVMLLALIAFPIANYKALRWLDFSPLTAAWGALFSLLISAQGKYGIEFESFVWTGWGLFTQLVALPILPLALAGGFRAISENRKTLGYAALLAAAFLSHILYGYIAALSMLLVPFMVRPFAEVKKRLVVLFRYLLQSFCLIAFFAVPLIMNRAYHFKSFYDEASKFNSHGAKQILTWLLSGQLFDAGRLPVLTCLVAAGLYLCGRKWFEQRSAVHGWAASGFLFWILLYFGRATWGPLIDLLPMSHGLHFERLSSGVHIFGIWLAAVAMGTLSRWALGLQPLSLRVGAGALILLLILPVSIERAQYLIRNTKNIQHDMEIYTKELPQIAPFIAKLKEDPEARAYAGNSGNWGHSYRIGSVEIYQLLSAEAISTATHAPFSWALSTDVGFQFSPNERESYSLYNVQYLMTDQENVMPPGAELIMHSGRHRLYRILPESPFSIVSVPAAVIGDKETTWYFLMGWAKGIWPRKQAHVRLIYDGQSVQDEKLFTMEDLYRFSYTVNGRTVTQHVLDPPGVFMTEPPSPPEGTIADTGLSRNEAHATVSLNEPGIVLFKTTYHPNWHAELDGSSVKTVLLSPGFVGVRVPAGTHRLQMRYDPGWIKVILLLLGPAAAFWIEMLSHPDTLWRKTRGPKK